MVRAYHHTHAEGLQCLPTIEHGCSTEKKKRHHEWVRLPAEQLLVANIPTCSVVDKFSPVTSEFASPLAVPGHGDLSVGGSTFKHSPAIHKVARNFLAMEGPDTKMERMRAILRSGWMRVEPWAFQNGTVSRAGARTTNPSSTSWCATRWSCSRSRSLYSTPPTMFSSGSVFSATCFVRYAQ